MTITVLTTEIPGLPRFATGKVRDVYNLGDTLLLVTSDRISAFDVIMPNEIPNKGRVLTQLSRFWFRQLRPLVPTHYITTDENFICDRIREAGGAVTNALQASLQGRAVLRKSRQKRSPSNALCAAISPGRSGKNMCRQAELMARSRCMAMISPADFGSGAAPRANLHSGHESGNRA